MIGDIHLEEQSHNTIPEFKVKHFKKMIMVMFAMCLPFGQAFTINVVFPLKLSEISIFLFLGYLLLKIVYEGDLKFSRNFITFYLVGFIGVVFASTVVNCFKTFSYPLNSEVIRITKNVDSFLKFIYLVFAFVGMQITIMAVKTYGADKVLKWLYWGAIIASICAWYLFIFSALGLPTLLLPSMDNPPQTLNLSFGSVIRCGTFKEGNYMGLFLFITGVLARYNKKTMLSNFFFATVITTFSTVSFICILLFLFFTSLSSRKSRLRAILLFVVLFLGLVALTIQNEDFRSNVTNKIFASEDEVDNPNDVVSRLDRLNTTQIGIQLFLDNPIFGVGPANYGLHFDQYNQLPKFGEGDYKRIPNNAYIEVLSESGIIAFLLFAGFVVIIIKQAIKTKNKYLLVGNILCFIYLIAFPTYTMLHIWFLWGFVIAVAETKEVRLTA